jgi:ferrous iron transport protein A
MHDMLAEPAQVAGGQIAGRQIAVAKVTAAPLEAAGRVRLSAARPGDRGVIVDVGAQSHPGGHGVDVHELERRLLEFGFVEGAAIEVLHEGAIRRDPIAVRLDDMRVALRRRDAEDVWIQLDRP